MSWLVRVQSSGVGGQKYRWLLVSGLCLIASACGFQPMYGAGGKTGQGTISGVAIEINASDRRAAQQFQISLEDKLNPSGAVPADPTYRLVSDLNSSIAGLGVSRDGTATRYNVNLTSNYTLYRKGEEKPITSGSLRHVSSYNNLPNQYYSTFVSEQDAIRRGVTELSELYRQRLSPYLSQNINK